VTGQQYTNLGAVLSLGSDLRRRIRMGCPSEVEIGDNLVFGICTHDPDTGVLTDADAVPDWWLYEEENNVEILSGVMAKFNGKTGHYLELVACIASNGFENGKNYSLFINATVDSDKGGIQYTFKAYDRRKADVVNFSASATGITNLISVIQRQSHEGDIGTEILLDTGVDITDATLAEIKYQKPDGTTGSWTGVVDSTTKVKYVTLANDLDQAGQWLFQSYVETPTWKGHGETVSHKVWSVVG
jgi:hypothetical protein